MNVLSVIEASDSAPSIYIGASRNVWPARRWPISLIKGVRGANAREKKKGGKMKREREEEARREKEGYESGRGRAGQVEDEDRGIELCSPDVVGGGEEHEREIQMGRVVG